METHAPVPSRIRNLWSNLRWLLESGAICPLCDARTFVVCDRCERDELLESEVSGLAVYHLGIHEERLSARIVEMKHRETTAHAFPLAALFARSLRRFADFHDATLVPVPLHPERLVERGYNQSALLARGLATFLGASFSPNLLERARATEKQAHLDERGRLENLNGAFLAKTAKRDPGPLWLVDDVCTTGATLEHCFQALRAGGFEPRGALTLSCSASRGRRARRIELPRFREEGSLFRVDEKTTHS